MRLLAVVQKLEAEGLTRAQAVGVMEALEDVVQESIRSMVSQLVTRAEQDKVRRLTSRSALTRQSLYTQKVDFAKLKSEIQLVEKQDFAVLKVRRLAVRPLTVAGRERAAAIGRRAAQATSARRDLEDERRCAIGSQSREGADTRRAGGAGAEDS